MNVVDRYDCIDRELSEYRCLTNSDDIYSIVELVLNITSVPEGVNIFLLESFQKAVISENLKNALENSEITGLNIVPDFAFSL